MTANDTTTPRALFALALTAQRRGGALAAATALLMVHQLCEAAIPVLIGQTIDSAVLPHDAGALVLWLAAMVGVFAVLTTSYQLASRLMVTVYGYGEQALRDLALSRILRPRLVRQRLSPGEVLTYVTSDSYRVAGIAWSVAHQGATLAAIVAAGLIMAAISPVAALVVFGSTVLLMLVMRVVSRPLERRGRAEQEAATEAGAVAADFMAGFRVLVGMGARGEAVRRYRTASQSSRSAAIVAGRSLAGFDTVSAILATLATTGVTGLAAWLASGGQITIGELVTILGLAQFVSGALAYAGTFATNWIHKYASAKRLADLINTDDLLDAPGDSSEQIVAPSDVALSFPIGAERVDVRDGEMVGIRPADSDAARELSALLGMRLPAPRGCVFVKLDGGHHDLTDLDPLTYRRHVVAAPHHHTVLGETLGEGVRSGTAHAEPRTEFITTAGLDDTLDTLGGWDAPIGAGGRRLSGGQRQRLALARALHAEAGVLVLDEPTSAVDPVTEALIAERLGERSETLVVITTSEVLLGACDRVIDLPGKDDSHV